MVGPDRFMSNVNRFVRGLSSEPIVSTSMEETTLQFLRDCDFVRSFWPRIVPPSRQSIFLTVPLRAWLAFNLELDMSSTDNWITIVCCDLFEYKLLEIFEDV